MSTQYHYVYLKLKSILSDTLLTGNRKNKYVKVNFGTITYNARSYTLFRHTRTERLTLTYDVAGAV